MGGPVTRLGQSFSTMDGGQTWREHDLPEGSGSAVARHPHAHTVITRLALAPDTGVRRYAEAC